MKNNMWGGDVNREGISVEQATTSNPARPAMQVMEVNYELGLH